MSLFTSALCTNRNLTIFGTSRLQTNIDKNVSKDFNYLYIHLISLTFL